MTRQIFRQAALDRLASPEQLDRLVLLTDPKGWIALAALGALVLGTVAWGFVGTIPSNVKGEGILLAEQGRVSDAMAPAAGTLSAIEVAVEAVVTPGQPLARISQTGLAQQLVNLDELIRERQSELERKRAGFARERQLKQRNLDQRRTALTRSLAAAEQRAAYLQTLLEQLEQLAARGISPRQKVQETRTDLAQANKEAGDARSDLLKLDAEDLDTRLRQDRELDEIETRLNDARRQKRELEARQAEQSVVIAPVGGRVIEIKRSVGAVVAMGDPLLAIEAIGGRIEAVVFIPTEDGKKVTGGMAVRVTPDTVKKEEWGSLAGTVGEVSEYPVTRRGMESVLQNPALVEQFSKNGSPYAVRVGLIPDPGNPTGYRWTSGKGPPMAVTTGTTVKAEVTVERRRPIDLVLPAVRKAAGIYP